MKNLQTKQCKCGYNFEIKNIKPPLLRVPKGFYGGNVDRTCAVTCPGCGTGYSLWIKQKGQTWRVVTLAGNVQEEVAPKAVKAKVDPPSDVVDEFTSMDKAALQEWLTERSLPFHKQLGDKRLRDLVRSAAAAIAKEVKEEDTDL